MSGIVQNLNNLKEEIKKSALKANRDPEDIVLVAVTKTVDIDRIKEAVNAGATDIGENRIQEAKQKFPELSSLNIGWHLVGHLQTNKVKDALKMFKLIHSVDSIRLAEEIDKEAKKQDKIISCLIEVNSGSELSKFGLKFEEVLPFIKETEKLENIKFSGLMTVAPVCENTEEVRPFFRKMKGLFDNLSKINLKNVEMKHLSMGMSSDYKTAIEEGSNMVRIGTAIFGERM